MTEHAMPSPERYCDVCVVGGSAAGLAAALQLGRQRRAVIVVDSGEARNAPAVHMHGYLGREGDAPERLTGDGREEVRRYGGEILPGRVSLVQRADGGGFRVETADGRRINARRVLAATGLVDDLPDIEGLAQHWGGDVIHCPFCHGYEVRDRRVVLIVTHPMALHPATLFHTLTGQLSMVVHDATGVAEQELDALRAAGIDVRNTPVRRVVTGADGHVAAVDLADGTRIDADAVAVVPRYRVRAEPFAAAGLHTVAHPSGLGETVQTDATGATDVPGLYAAGNVVDPSQQVLAAAADGSRVGAMIAFSLAAEDLQDAARPTANQNDWDHRYGGERVWSGNPNGSLVAEVAGMAPGRALDVGAGEGGDALWLVEQGWDVTASDVSQRGLDLIGEEAQRRGVKVARRHADANALEPFGAEAFDLVSAHYASIPRTADRRAVHNLLAAVAPGGTLLVVSHDLEPMRTAADPHGHARAFDPDAYVRVEDVAEVLADAPGWQIEVHEKRPRPPGAASASHHVEDVVLRARRVLADRSASLWVS